ncbi:MAG: Methyltransferase type 11 [Schlesneria sp.]|nr:Methyltransferase type 11 [Schlesneria sp.]
MKIGISFSLFIAIGITGCGQQQAAPVTEVNKEKTGEHQERDEPKERSMHGDHKHHHPFSNPAQQAKKWNNQERDKWQHPEEIVAALALRPGATVAEIGAGTGYMVAPLSNAVGRDGIVIPLDSSAEMIEYLIERSAELGPAKVLPKKVHAHDPELQPATVDAVLTLDTWHHVDSREAYAKKVYEALKPDGRFVVVDYNVDAEVGPPQSMRLAPERVVKQLEAAGFRVEVVKESMPRHYLVVGFKD